MVRRPNFAVTGGRRPPNLGGGGGRVSGVVAVRPLSACALVAASCLFTIHSIGSAFAVPHARSRGFVAHAPALVHHPRAHRGVLHRSVRRQGHFHRFAASGWPGYFDGFAAPIEAGSIDEPGASRAEFGRPPSPFDVPVVVGIREARPSRPAIIVIGHAAKGARSTRSIYRQTQLEPAAQPLILHVAPGRR